jgi:transposase-like protein
MKKQRKHYTPEEKVAILRRHLLDKEPISKLCDELGLQPTVFYRWQKEFFENGAAAFEQKRPANHSAEQERIAYLEKKIWPRLCVRLRPISLKNPSAWRTWTRCKA